MDVKAPALALRGWRNGCRFTVRISGPPPLIEMGMTGHLLFANCGASASWPQDAY